MTAALKALTVGNPNLGFDPTIPGTKYEQGSSKINLNAVIPIDTTHSLILYSDFTNAVLYARILEVDANGNISAGAETTVEAASTGRAANRHGSGVVLDSTHVLVMWQNTNSSATVYARVLEVNLTTNAIDTVGTRATVKSASSGSGANSCVKLTSAKAIVQYRVGATNYAQVLDISGTTITTNTELNLSEINNLQMAGLSSTKAVCVGNGSSPVAFVVSVSGSTVTKHSNFAYESNVDTVYVDELDSTHIAVAFHKSADSEARLVILEESSNSLSKGTVIEPFAADSSIEVHYCLVAKLTSEKLLVVATNFTPNPDEWVMAVCGYSGKEISDPPVINSDGSKSWSFGTELPMIGGLDSDLAIISATALGSAWYNAVKVA